MNVHVQSIQPSHTRLVTRNYLICLSKRMLFFVNISDFFTPDRVNVNRFETSCSHFILLSIQKTSQYYKESTVVVSPLNGIVRSFATGRCFDKYLRFLHPIEKMLTDLKCSRISRSNSTNSIDILLKLMHSKTIKSELIM